MTGSLIKKSHDLQMKLSKNHCEHFYNNLLFNTLKSELTPPQRISRRRDGRLRQACGGLIVKCVILQAGWSLRASLWLISAGVLHLIC